MQLFGRNRIRELRESAGMSQAALAEMAGISDTTLQNYEYGRRDIPAKVVRKLSAIFDVPTDYLLCNDSPSYVAAPSLGLRLTVGDEERPAALPADAEKVVDVWSQLDPDMRGALEHAADMLLSIQRSRGRS